MKKTLLILAALSTTACTVSDNPADGGFLSGIVGIGGGEFERRQEASQFALAQAQAEATAAEEERVQLARQNASLTSQIARLEAQYTAVRQGISAQIASWSASGQTIDPSLVSRATVVLGANPTGSTDRRRLASLQAAIAQARALAADMAAV